MKMETAVSSETSAIRTQTPGNYPKRNTLHLEHGKSLKQEEKASLIMCFIKVQIRKLVSIMSEDSGHVKQ